jgi:hypothetical protein
MTADRLRKVALLDRFGAGRSAGTHVCDFDFSCWSIKREGREAILRFATYGPPTPYPLCVIPPAGRQTCRTFAMSPDREGLQVSRVRWSKHFPDRGHGIYRVRWRDNPRVPAALSFRR